MSHSGNERWFQTFFDRIGRVLGTVVRPWTAFNAVKDNQTDVINALGSQQADIANALVQIRTMRQELARLEATVAEQKVDMRRLLQLNGTSSVK